MLRLVTVLQLSFFGLFVACTPLKAQIAGWDFTGQSNIATFNATTSNVNLAAVPNLARGGSAPAAAGSNSFRTTGFQNNGISVTNTDYFQTTLKAAIGYTLSLSSIDAVFAGTTSFNASPGVTSQFAYSLDGISFTLIGSSGTSTSLTLPQINLAGISVLQNVAATTTVTLRYYASGQTTTGGWGFNSPASGSLGFAIGGSLNAVATCAAPTVSSTTSVANMTTTTADVSGTITGTGGGTNITSRSIAYSTSSALSSPTANTATGTFGTGSFTRNITALSPNTDYYYRVSAINDCTTPQLGYSHTSSFPSFTTLPVATVPNTGATGSNGFTVNWTAATGNAASTTYTLEVDDDNTFASVLQTQSGITGTSYNVAGLTPSTAYYYRLKVVNASGVSAWSAILGPVTTAAFIPYTPTTGDWRARNGIIYSGVNYSNNWERYNGTAWVNVTGSPYSPSGNTISRMIVNTFVDAAGNSSANTGLNFDIVIVSGGEFALYDNASGALSSVPAYFGSNRSITVQGGGKLTIQGDFKMPAGSSIIAENGSIVEIDQASISTLHPMWGGTENFKEGSIVSIKDHSFTTALVNSTNFSTNTDGYLFGNLNVELAANAGDWSITEGAAGSFNLCRNNFTVSNSGSKRITLMANTGSVTIHGSLYNNGSVFSMGSQLATASGTQTIDINGDMEIDGTNYLKYNSSTAFANYYTTSINLKGNLTVYGTFTDGPAFSASATTLPILIWNGTNEQTVDAAAALDFSKMIINKTTGNLTLNTPLTVKSNITLTKGIINTTATSILSIADDAAADGASDNCFVNGPVAKIGNDVFEFPIGKSGKYRPAAISAPSSNLEVFTAEYFSNAHPVTVVNTPLSHISAKEYWNIERILSGPIDVTLSWNSQSAVNEALDLRMAHFNNTSWDDLGISGLTINTTTNRITKTGVTNFSPFTIGTINVSQPLPVKISRFEAVKVERKAAISYEVQNVSEGEEMSVERSVDGRSFTALDMVTATANGTFYKKYTDMKPEAQHNYYRVAAKAANGGITYSKILQLNFVPEVAAVLQVYPSPAKTHLYLRWDDAATPAELKLVNNAGLVVYAQTVQGQAGTAIDMTPFSCGSYVITWRQGNKAENKQVEVSR